MTDCVTITYKFTIKSGILDKFKRMITEMSRETVHKTGFGNMAVVQNKDDPNQILMIQKWHSEQAFHDYVAWRTERGETQAFNDLLTAPPEVAFWPAEIVSRVSQSG